MKPIRRSTFRFAREQAFLAEWLSTVRGTASKDITVAVEIAQLRNLVKGYGETHERGLMKYRTIRGFVTNAVLDRDLPSIIRRLVSAAQKTEDNVALDAEIAALANVDKAASVA